MLKTLRGEVNMKAFGKLLLGMLMLSSMALADDQPKDKFSGYMFSDFYYVADNHNENIKDQNGFWFRRIYFTYDYKYSNALSTRLRFEMNSPGDFSTSSKLEPAVKDAYLKWKKSGTEFYLGISSTPTWEVIEKVWGYRSVEKTPLDLQKYGSSRDFGVAIKGNLEQSGKVKYHLMLGNGNSNKSETNKGKKAMLAVSLYPTENLILEAYGDWNDNPGDNDVFTFQGFIAYKTPKARIGVQFAQQTRNVDGSEDVDLKIGSVFVAGQVGEKINAFARVDRTFDPNPSAHKISYIPMDKTTKSTFFVGGLDFEPEKNVHLMPNMELVRYDENDAGETPNTDIIPRLTFYWVFK
jgi:hypothetical protein